MPLLQSGLQTDGVRKLYPILNNEIIPYIENERPFNTRYNEILQLQEIYNFTRYGATNH